AVGTARWMLRAETKVGVLAGQVCNDLAHTADRAIVVLVTNGGIWSVVKNQFFLEPLTFGRVEPLQHFSRDDLGDGLDLQILGVKIHAKALHHLDRGLIADSLMQI